jgi:hypothetical protein
MSQNSSSPKIILAPSLKGGVIFSDFHSEFIPTTEGGRGEKSMKITKRIVLRQPHRVNFQ